ncbi:pre-mRNA-splicing factor 38A, putative [Plasmodium berghei]|uniref:Pre-mRNA-splicing factor 38 n=2 Tax=Plasmodium berghei TaxID=5821 RepID=A0A509AJQ2_PLABA|nr:pre-mRNA-splicing factor 38A, putative [Plasmodium berghei ANKA]CXI41973.1 pre-mRNA-splicing factor 38A, putative [Plasmodium berghei]SCM22015.1 pre-mRNA-splicing factor 38A, putative [Plasmodium berghei]SCN25230.1 pre-mRNA-splicing factor 38A, putative [Plasmodium berghei]SCO60217.1 pre-mRNA-splicing factor 38A, putative [Plasmodium berghei]SCO61844.1 pre-mRNA-splicing factor 38A, putative [Plasmodium berghei]|eukprot:XP_034421509.1 pre-mRNA-splicing factor 38A, putative [Plasmodium berghei ANKA]
MANRTDVNIIKSFGSNPQFLISNIIRNKIYDSPYWKEKCFALTSESIIDQAVNLKYAGGTYGGNRKPTRFLCLVLKLLQLQPDKDIIYEFIKNEEFIYLRALGIFYLRLIGKGIEIYKNIEPILFDYRKIRIRLQDGSFQKMYMDVFADNCLVFNNFLDVDFPPLTKRIVLEENNLLEKINLDYYKELLDISSENELFINNKKNKIHLYNKKTKRGEIYDDNNYTSQSSEQYYSKRKSINRENKKGFEKKKKRRTNYTDKDYYKKKSYSSSNDHSRSLSSKSYEHEKNRKKKKKKYSEDSDYEEKKREKKKKSNKKKNEKEGKHKYEKSKNALFDVPEKNNEEMSVERWNKIREELGMKPLK